MVDLTFDIATGYRGGSLLTLEGGSITIMVQVNAGVPSDAILENIICGTATNTAGPVVVCDDDRVRIENPDLFLRKLLDRTDPRSGDTLTYTLILSNEGDHRANDVVLTDLLPVGVTYVTNSTRILSPASYSIGEPSVAGQMLRWSTGAGNAISNAGLPAAVLLPNSGEFKSNIRLP